MNIDLTTLLGSLSLLGFMTFLVAYYALPPNISIEETKDKINQNLESRFVIKNIGKLPADKLIFDVVSLNLKTNNTSLTDNNAFNCGKPVNRLASGEKTEIPVLPFFGTVYGKNANECRYSLVIKYEIPFPFFRPKLTKTWDIKLVTSLKEFAWQAELK